MKDVIAALTDSYSRNARLYPTVLAFLPLFWSTYALSPETLAVKPLPVVGAGLVLGAIVVFLTSIARSRGKVVEQQLLASWGTWQTTIILRHRDTTIDSVTKTRYHARLQGLHKELRLPTADDEAKDSPGADAQYRAATTRLIERRRDAKYKLLHKENESYGFRRNLLGMKPVALMVTALAAALTLAVCVLGFTRPDDVFVSLFSDISTRWPLYASLGADFVYFLFFVIFVRPHYVRQAANEYALALFRTLDAEPRG